MYPATNLANFVDPVQDITVEVPSVLVQRTYRAGADELLHKVVDVKTKRYFDGHHSLWYVTEFGDYVQGAPVNPTLPTGMPVVGIINDDLFVVGAMGEKPFGDATPFVRITNVMRSDRQTLGGQEYSTHSCHVAQWLKAAPWAERLLPSMTDGVGSAAAKLGLASQLYRKRQALAEIINQMVIRDLEDDLEELTENHSLPAPTFGAMVTANAYIPTTMSLDEERMTVVRGVTERAGVAGAVNSDVAYARINMTFMYPGDAGTKAEVQAFNVNDLSRHAAGLLSVRGLSVTATTVTPAMRGLSF